jgi:hypothetical protein
MAYNDVSESGMNFVTLQQMINDYIITMQEDDYDSSASDVVIRNFALRGIRELGFDLSRRIKSLKLAVNTTNKTVDLPDDFVNWVKVGVVGDDGIVHVLRHNKAINYSQKYEVDSSGDRTNETNDSQQGPLNIDDNYVLDREASKSATAGALNVSTEDINNFNAYIFRNFVWNNNVGRLYGVGGGQGNGEFRVNLDENRIELEVNGDVTEVVIEYIADEARSTNPVIHVFLEEALRAYVYYKIISRSSAVPSREKHRAEKEWGKERRKAKIRQQNITKEEILGVIRQNFKQAPKA